MSKKPKMTDDEKVNAIALSMQTVMSELSAAYTHIAGGTTPEILLVIGCCDVQQFGANVPRESSMAQLKALLQRWQMNVDMPLPGEITPSLAFTAMLHDYDLALKGRHKNPALDITMQRRNLLEYVSGLELKARRAAP